MTISSQKNQIPYLPNPALRPHLMDIRNRPMLKSWLKITGGVVIYASYPRSGKSSEIWVRPLWVDTASLQSWHPDSLVRDAKGQVVKIDGKIQALAPQTTRLKNVEYTVIDVVLEDLELIGSKTQDTLLDSAFSWAKN